jgi:uroporphyrinogen decarboxylase
MTTAAVSKSERIRRTLAGEAVDRPAITFWAHNFAMENSAEALAEQTVDAFRRFDWDFIKVQSRASVFAEMWGSRYRFSTERAVPPRLLEWPVHSARDLAALRPQHPETGALGEQLEALRQIREAVGPDVPVLMTIFAPAMVLQFLVGESADAMLKMIRNHPKEAHLALAAVRETLNAYVTLCIGNGADGIFLAVKAASERQMTRAEYAEFGLPYDRPVLDAAGQGWLNMLHLCESYLYFEVVKDLATPLLSWALDPGNPSLSRGRDAAQRAVIGGVSPKPRIRDMTVDEVKVEVLAALKDTDGVRTMIGPGCSISPDTPEANLFSVRAAVQEWLSQTR